MELTDEQLDAAREILRAEFGAAVHDGTTCSVCDRQARVYRRKLNAGMALALRTMYERAGLAWFHKPTILRGVGASARDETFLRFWGLIEERYGNNPDGRAGWWRVTPRGESFVLGLTRVPKYVHTYNGNFIRLSGELIDFVDAGGEPFDLREMLAS